MKGNNLHNLKDCTLHFQKFADLKKIDFSKFQNGQRTSFQSPKTSRALPRNVFQNFP